MKENKSPELEKVLKAHDEYEQREKWLCTALERMHGHEKALRNPMHTHKREWTAYLLNESQYEVARLTLEVERYARLYSEAIVAHDRSQGKEPRRANLWGKW